MGSGETGQFRYEFRLVAWLAPAVPLAGLLALTLWARHVGHNWFPQALILAGVTLGCVWGLAHDLLLARFGGVWVDDTGVTLSDWRGRQVGLRWEEVAHLRQYGGFWRWWRGLPVEIRGSGGRALRVRPRLAGEDRLVEVAVQRAGLTDTEQKWWGTQYTRP